MQITQLAMADMNSAALASNRLDIFCGVPACAGGGVCGATMKRVEHDVTQSHKSHLASSLILTCDL
jgi:hypothetical protein